MKTENIIIRREEEKDHAEVENLVRESFWNVYRPGCVEHYLLHTLRGQDDFVKELDFVMEKDGRIIGQNVFVRAKIDADDGREIPVLMMGPICVAQELKRQGYGQLLLRETLSRAAEMGFGAVCIEGNHAFYSTCGFRYASEFGLRYRGLPEGADASFFLAAELKEGYLRGCEGEFADPECYFVSDEEVEAFDREFPPKEKLKLPGQLV